MATEGRVREIINEVIAQQVQDGGVIHTAVANQIAASTAEQGAISIATGQLIASGVAPGGAIHAAFSQEYTRSSNEHFPWRKVLGTLSPAQWKVAWDSIKVDPDQEAAVTQGMESGGSAGGAMGHLVALGAAYPENEELKALKRQAALKHLPRTSWKQLCLPDHGGGPDRFRCYIGEKAESSTSSQHVRALARALLSLYTMLEARWTVLSRSHQAMSKAECLRKDLMPLLYNTIKCFKHRTFKASASVPEDAEVLLWDFGLDLVLGQFALNRSAAPSLLKRAGAPPTDAAGERPTKQPRAEFVKQEPRGPAQKPDNRWSRSSAGAPATAAPVEAPPTPPAGGRKQVAEALERELAAWAPGKSAQYCQQWLDDKKTEGAKSAVYQLERSICKNCLYSGRGVVKHSFADCRTAGNRCVLPCPKCLAAHRLNDLYHWIHDCKFKD